MRLIAGGGIGINKRTDEREDKFNRRGLLAKVHIAKKEINLSEDQYGAILHGFGVESAAGLSIDQLERLVKYLKYLGWKPSGMRKKASEENRIKALQDRIKQLSEEMGLGEERMTGIVKKVFRIDHPAWLRDEGKLTRLLAILGSIRARESQKGSRSHEKACILQKTEGPPI